MTAPKPRKTREETAEEQCDRLLCALANLEQSARDFAVNPTSYRAELSRAALLYARRVRRIAGVR